MMNILIGLGIGLVAGFIGYSYGLYGSKELVSVEDVDKAIEETKRAIIAEYETNIKAMADYYDTVITKELEEQYDNVVDLSEYRNRR